MLLVLIVIEIWDNLGVFLLVFFLEMVMCIDDFVDVVLYVFD